MPAIPALRRGDLAFVFHQGDLSAAIREGQVTPAHPRIEDIPSHVFGFVDDVPEGLTWSRPGVFGSEFTPLRAGDTPKWAATRCLVEARARGIQLNSLLGYVDSEETEVEVWRCSVLAGRDRENVLGTALSLVGHKYGFIADALALIDDRVFGGRVVLRCLSPLTGAYNCSMLWAFAYRSAAQVCWPTTVDPRGVTPADLRSGVEAAALRGAWQCMFSRGHLRLTTVDQEAAAGTGAA